VDELFNELRQHGITILASMIVGFPYQTPEIIEEELSGLLALKPVFSQFLIYGPCPGTPFYEQVVREGTLIPEVKDDKELFFLQGTGFHSMVQHPTMSSAGIEAAQQRCFEEEFRRLGPSIHRSVARWFEGYLTLRGSASPLLRAKAEQYASDIRKAYPSFLAGRLFGPTREVRRGIAELQRRTTAELGAPTLRARIESVAGVALAAWTSLTLRLGLFQHPRLMRHTFRMPAEKSGRAWARLRGRISPEGASVEVERRPASTVWVRLEGSLSGPAAGHLSAKLRAAMSRKNERVVLDLGRVSGIDESAAHRLAEGLRAYRHRIRVILPRVGEFAAIAAVFTHYR
jgi:anti-anti-sigma regulatory factor